MQEFKYVRSHALEMSSKYRIGTPTHSRAENVFTDSQDGSSEWQDDHK
jgi:hypothetical protein